MIEQIKQYDERLLLFLNKFHAPWLDPVMLLITRTEFWTPLFALLIFLIFKSYRRDGWKVMAGAVVVITLASVITALLMKPYFQRLRPSQEPSLVGIIHLVDNYNGGLYGFASGHAANSFGVALYSYFVLRKYYRWIGLIFMWAILMMYTRIYLGVHYPGDILAGIVVGAFSAICGYLLYRFLYNRALKLTK